MRRFALLIIALFFLPFSAMAESYGLAMHGAAKYDAQSAHLTYANPDAPKGGHLKRSAIGTFDTLNPFSIKGKAAKGLNLYYDRLMRRVWDEAFTMYPLIAESYDIAPDRSWVSFTINPKARFNNGSPITAADVLFSFETLKTSGRPNMRQVYKLVSRAEKTSEHTVKFSFGEGYDQETAMIMAMMPVLSKDYWQGREFDSTTLDIPVSSGPYTIASVDAGRSITYARDPNYWAKDLLPNIGHHNFDQVTHEYYRDGSVAFEAFGSGQLNVHLETDANRWRSGYELENAEALTRKAVAHQRPEKARAMIFNTRRAPFDDIRVRQALSLLFDEDSLNTLIYDGEQKRITSFYPNSELAASQMSVETPETYRTKMRSAQALLKEAGWMTQDGKQMKDGAVLGFEIIISGGEDEKIALHYKKSLERLGITLQIRSLDSAAFIDRLRGYDYDMVLYHWLSSLSPGTEQTLYWGCEARDQEGRWNYAGICDPDIDKLASTIANSTTRQALLDTTRALDEKLTAGVYAIPLFYRGADLYAWWAPLQKPETTPAYGAVLETWWMDQPADQNDH